MKQLLRLILGVWVCTFVAVSFASSGFFHRQCAASLELELASSSSSRNFQRYDFHIGLSYYHTMPLIDTSTYSPDGLYSYDQSQRYTVNDYNVFLVNNATLERQLIYGSPLIIAVYWSQDSRALLIWEYDRDEETSILTSYDIVTHAINFQHEITAIYPIGQSPDKRYIYAQFFLDEAHLLRGVLFVDTVTGNLTRFTEPSELHYIWSADSRWVASQFQDRLLIIDPETGDFHPTFNASIQGDAFIWQGEYLWFTRFNRRNGSSIWRASLSDGSLTLMIEDARLEALSNDGRWIYIHDRQHADMAVYDVLTGNRLLFHIGDQLTKYRDTIRFSTDTQCAALILTNDSIVYEISVYNLQSFRQIQSRTLAGTYININWVNSGD